jgi:heme exporter protein A
MLSIHQLICHRGHRPLFADVSFELHPGELLHIQGKNGVGKTTLLRLICGLSTPQAGQIRWQGQDTRQDPQAFRADLFYLGHQLALKEELTAVENLQADAAVAGRTLSLPQAYEALARMGLRGRERLPVRVMSQGQKRRTALARLYACPATLWVLDEPFVALDSQAQATLQSLLVKHVSAGGMVLLTSHQPVSLQQEDGSELAVRTLALKEAI